MAEIASSVIRRPVTVLAVGALALAGRASGQTSLSIYSDGRVVVRRTLPQALEKGRTALTLKIDGLDPATLFSPDTSVALVSAVARPATDRGTALQAAVGQTLAFVHGKGDTVRATVLRVAPPQYRLSDGRILLSEPGEPLFPAELVRTLPEVAVVVEAARAGGARARHARHHRAVPPLERRLLAGADRPRGAAVARLPGLIARGAEPRSGRGVVHAQAGPRHAVRRPAAPRRHGRAVPAGLGWARAARGRGAKRPHRAGPGPARAVGKRVRRDRRAGADRLQPGANPPAQARHACAPAGDGVVQGDDREREGRGGDGGRARGAVRRVARRGVERPGGEAVGG